MGVMSRVAAAGGDRRSARSQALPRARFQPAVGTGLADFWFNHFNIFEGKDRVRAMLASYERDAIRPHTCWANSRTFCWPQPVIRPCFSTWTTGSPCRPMYFQIGPFAPGPFTPAQQLARQAHGLNENYGRELLELHTLGVNGGYTQQDVIAVARCFTGWTIRQPNQKPEFAFAAFMHDTAEKRCSATRSPRAAASRDGLQVIDILAQSSFHGAFHFHQARAALRVRSIRRRPSSHHMARTFTKTDGDLRAVLETMFTSREFFSEAARQSRRSSRPWSW